MPARIVALGLLLLSCLGGAGCGAYYPTRIESLPKEEAEWRQSLAVLERHYPELAHYSSNDRIFGRILQPFGPPMSDVTKFLGEPDAKRFSGWLVGKFLFFPIGPFFAALEPNWVWVWHKGDYRIEAVVNYAFEQLYAPELFYFDIEELTPEEKRARKKALQQAPAAAPPVEADAGGSGGGIVVSRPLGFTLPPGGIEIVERKAEGLVQAEIRPLSVTRRMTVSGYANAYAYLNGRRPTTIWWRCDRCGGAVELTAACACSGAKKAGK